MELAYSTVSLPRAEVIVSMLKAYGIHAEIFSREFSANNGHLALTDGGYRIMVPESQMRDAAELLVPFREP